MSMKTKAIIFDKDGVLVNSEEIKATAWQQTLSSYLVEDGFSWYLRNLGPTCFSLASKAITQFQLHISSPTMIANEWYENYQTIQHRVKPIEENLQLLSSLSKQYIIGIASSMDKETIESEMLRFGYWQYVTDCISGQDVRENKPAPYIYIEAAKILEVDPSNCIAIEDSPTGVRSAKSAGIRCVGFKNPLYDLDLSAADLVVSDLTQIDFAKF